MNKMIKIGDLYDFSQLYTRTCRILFLCFDNSQCVVFHGTLFTRFGIVPHLVQALHPLQAPQLAQLPPQALFPAFLSRIMLRTRSPTISTMTETSTILIRLADSHTNIGSLP